MENFLNLIMQPKPQILPAVDSSKDENAPGSNKNTERKINRPSVGVIKLEKISNTPISDTLELKRQENPYTKYKLSEEKKGKFSIKEFVSFFIFSFGLVSLSSLFKGKKAK